MNTRLSLFFLILFVPGIGCVLADDVQEEAAGLFARGNAAYQEGDFEKAEQHYRQILDLGTESGPIYYNLGNACFKQKRLGEAVYFWEKARQTLPADRDIEENLELASLLLVDRIEIPSDPLPLEWFKRVMGLLTIGQEVWLVLALFIAANILFTLYLLLKNPRNAFRALLIFLGTGILFLIFAGSLSWKVYERDFRKSGVVVEQKVDVLSGPGTDNITVFTIHEGIKVRVHGATNGWLQISLPNGWNGWLPAETVLIL